MWKTGESYVNRLMPDNDKFDRITPVNAIFVSFIMPLCGAFR